MNVISISHRNGLFKRLCPCEVSRSCSLPGEYTSQHQVSSLIHSKSGSLNFLFSDFRRHNVCRKMSVAKVRKIPKRGPHWKMHFVSPGWSLGSTHQRGGRYFWTGSLYDFIPCSNPNNIWMTRNVNTYQDKTNCIMEQWKIYMRKQKSSPLFLVK